MKNKIYINYIKTNPDISSNQKIMLDKIIKKHALIAGKILDVPEVTITVYPKSDWAISETGENGYCPSEDWIQIYIDPKNKNYDLKFIIENIIPGTIYHEMNHIARWRSTGFGETLLEAVATEGLASVFGKEQWKKFDVPWAKFDEREIDKLLKIAKNRNKKNDLKYNHGEWFFGEGKLPRWIGYKIGTHIVESFREKYPELSWNKLMKMKAEDIIKKSGVKI